MADDETTMPPPPTAAELLGELIRQVDAGELAATPSERAYLSGAKAVLRQVTQR